MATPTTPTSSGSPGLPPPPPAPPGPPTTGGARHLVVVAVAAVLALALLALVAVSTAEVSDARDEVDEIEGQRAAVAFSLAPDDPLTQLRLERNATALHLMGLDGVVVAAPDIETARAQTDAAFARLDTAIDGWPDDLAAAYAPVLDQRDVVAGVRAEVDEVPEASRTFDNDDARVLTGSYSAALQAIDDAGAQLIAALDAPEIRRGAELAYLASQQIGASSDLIRGILLALVGGDSNGYIDTADEITALAADLGDLRGNDERIAATADGPYRPHLDALLAAEATQQLPLLAEEALTTGAVDVTRLAALSEGDTSAVGAYATFHADVTAELVRTLDSVEDDATARQQRHMAIGVAAGIAAVVSLVVLALALAALARSRRAG